MFEIDPHAPRPRGAEAPKAFVGKTEVVRSSSCPHFTTFVDVSLRHTTNVLKQQQLVVSVIQVNAKGQHVRELGSTTFLMQELFKSRWKRLTGPCVARYSACVVGEEDRQPTTTVCAVEKKHGPDSKGLWTKMQFHIEEIAAAGIIEQPDTSDGGQAPYANTRARPTTYLQVSRQVQGFLQPVHRTEILAEWNPVWKETGTSFQKLCVCDEECVVAVELYTVDGKQCEQRPDLLLGQAFTTVRELEECAQAW
eukprot:COSAG01_NODE_1446_length_10280_cov_51.403791_8_plen_251_part_01